ncbi:hypothetical protein CYMTET_19240 [Cymbomonas tetramitiformis]|uniref:Uncharacterized protein n=1 Tax=Cymbomonas tetramitiformis TaxID=36881 RepID=A0AAE0G6F4_9CHLO|nr:hypothetical protein CYMTET_19240 [Cymbomonas tetramitiformis]
MVRTPPVPAPPAPAQGDTPAIVLARQRYDDAKTAVNAIYSKGRHRKWAKAIKQHALGGDYFSAKDDVSKLAKIVVALKAEIVTAGLEPDVFDLDTHINMGQLWESLDPDFYTAVRVRYPRLADLNHISLSELSDLVASIYVSWHTTHADQGGAAGTAASAAVPPAQGAFQVPPLPHGGRWTQISFIDSWFDCPLGGKREEAGSTAAYNCQPVDESAFAAACEQYGAPTVVDAGAASGGVDVSAYGSAVSDSD